MVVTKPSPIDKLVRLLKHLSSKDKIESPVLMKISSVPLARYLELLAIE